jgi:hypothetical protein
MTKKQLSLLSLFPVAIVAVVSWNIYLGVVKSTVLSSVALQNVEALSSEVTTIHRICQKSGGECVVHIGPNGETTTISTKYHGD